MRRLESVASHAPNLLYSVKIPTADLMKIPFVCMGNICHSPTVEGVFRHRIAALGLAGRATSSSPWIRTTRN